MADMSGYALPNANKESQKGEKGKESVALAEKIVL
jgi:hypothetical protein